MQKYLYFRTQATDADDDATDDSACWPASSLMGMQPTSDTALTLYFKPMLRGFPSGNEPDSDESFDNYDAVTLNLTTANTHLAAMKAITHAITRGVVLSTGFSVGDFIVIANDDSGGTEYLGDSGIRDCGAIHTQVAYAN